MKPFTYKPGNGEFIFTLKNIRRKVYPFNGREAGRLFYDLSPNVFLLKTFFQMRPRGGGRTTRNSLTLKKCQSKLEFNLRKQTLLVNPLPFKTYFQISSLHYITYVVSVEWLSKIRITF